MSLFSAVEMAPATRILGLNEQYNADTNPNKVNLGVGVLRRQRQAAAAQCVQAAEQAMMESPPRAATCRSTASSPMTTPSGPGLRRRLRSRQVRPRLDRAGHRRHRRPQDRRRLPQEGHPERQVLISDPSWENHRAIFQNAGFEVGSYAYYDAGKRGVNFEGMLADLNAAEAGTIVVLHACCHNPTGYDITPEQWDQVIAVVKAKGLTAFLDMAYQGFGYGIAEDGAVIGKFVAAGLNIFVSTSFPRASACTASASARCRWWPRTRKKPPRAEPTQDRDPHQLSNPPTHGGAVVAAVLGNPELRALWEQELGEMRVRIKAMRQKLVDGLKAAGVQQDMSFITEPDRHVQLLGPVQGPDGAPAQRVRRLRHRHRPHVRRRAQQQEHRLRLPVHRQGGVSLARNAASDKTPLCGVFVILQGKPSMSRHHENHLQCSIACDNAAVQQPIESRHAVPDLRNPTLTDRAVLRPGQGDGQDVHQPDAAGGHDAAVAAHGGRLRSGAPPGQGLREAEFGIRTVDLDGVQIAIHERVEVEKPFCELLRFKRYSDDPATLIRMKQQPVVLIVAPLSGHYATLLRDTVRTMLKDHKVYITDWKNARLVPLSEASSISTTTSTTCRTSSVTCRRYGNCHVMSVPADRADAGRRVADGQRGEKGTAVDDR